MNIKFIKRRHIYNEFSLYLVFLYKIPNNLVIYNFVVNVIASFVSFVRFNLASFIKLKHSYQGERSIRNFLDYKEMKLYQL